MESALLSLTATAINAGGIPALILGLAFIGWKFFGTISEQNANKTVSAAEMNVVLWERLRQAEQERDKYKELYFKSLAK